MTDIKSIRVSLLQFIKSQLRKAEGGEGGNIRGIYLYFATAAAERHLYEAATYMEDPEKFRNEIQRIADDFAIELPADWTLKISFEEQLPNEGMRIPDMPAALNISTTRKPTQAYAAEAYVTVLNGEAEQEQYVIKPQTGKVFIGRDKRVRTADGFFRENTIAFKADSSHESNKFVSRQHAHIEWNSEAGSYYLFADEGGIPPSNKIKIRQLDGSMIKLQSTQIGHRLQEGEQIILGDSALLRFSYSNA